MLSKVVILALAGLASCAVIDDGSYDARRYEQPYAGETSENTRSARTYAPSGNNFVQPSAPSRAYTADPRNAQILSEARYLQADGKFGSSYTQEDGVQFKEEADPDGTRRGSYTWVDPTGERRTVSYVAGKFGFQASGAHLPEQPPLHVSQEPEPQQQSRYQAPQAQSRYVAPQPQYQPEPEQTRYVAPQPQQYQPQPQQYQPQPQYQAPQPQPQQYQAPQPSYRPKAQYRAPEPEHFEGLGPSHPTITQSTADSYSISAAF